MNSTTLSSGLERNGDRFRHGFEGMGKHHGDGRLTRLAMFMVFWLSARVYLAQWTQESRGASNTAATRLGYMDMAADLDWMKRGADDISQQL